jgi:NAD(P)-dependent dehydrogenase (short-subunit alcohol dehydrogenase family)
VKTKHALIVGGSTGMGKAIAQRLLTNQVEVTLLARSAERLAITKEELSALGRVHTIEVDLTDFAAVDRFIEQLTDDERTFDFLVNAAGTFRPLPFLDHQKSDYDTYHRLNRSTFFITQAVASKMVQAKGGSIVNIGSMWANQAIKATPSSAYSMAKAGLHALTQHLAMELADHGIRVNAVAPAVVVTPIYGSFIEPGQIEETLQGFNSFHPLGRVGRPDDIAAVVERLLSDDFSWVTGAVWAVDGGVMAGRN